MSELLLGLGGEPIDPGIADTIVEQAGGNPLFAEQLLALAQEATELVKETPATVEALLASRLDRLDPRELSVLRRAAVIGRRFTRAELADLMPREEVDQSERHLAGLAERALIHKLEHVFAFHHVLVRDVAYRGIPKSDRAQLHELAARGLDRRNAADEIVGYHFEQAHRSLTEIGRLDDRARELAAAGGERLGSAGIRAWKRSDAPAAANLLSRAVALAHDADLMCEFALALYTRGERARALQVLADTPGARSELERAYLRSLTEPDQADELLGVAMAAIPVFERAADDRALGRAWYSVAHVRGGFYCEYEPMQEAAERIAACYARVGWPLTASADLLGLALTFGPKPVEEAIERLESLIRQDTGDRAVEANLAVWLGHLESMRANFDVARAHVDHARVAFRDLGLMAGVVDHCGRATGAIELLAGSPDLAETSLREACASLQELHDAPVLATRAAELAAALHELERYEEAAEWVRISKESAGEDDLDAALTRRPVEAKLLARLGDAGEAERLARETVSLAERTDALNRHAEALLALAEVLDLTGPDEESGEYLKRALALYERKGNVAAARLARRRLPRAVTR